MICDDPDAPSKPWVHWVIFNIPPGIKELPENVSGSKNLSIGAKQGINDFGKIGYGGPCPPSATHRYYFKLYALDIILSSDPGITKDELIKDMKGHIIEEVQIVAKYRRI
jgi:hypothetical protein